MKNFEKHIDRIFPVMMGDCGIYKLRMGSKLYAGAGCSRRCNECQQESRKWLLEETEDSNG